MSSKSTLTVKIKHANSLKAASRINEAAIASPSLRKYQRNAASYTIIMQLASISVARIKREC